MQVIAVGEQSATFGVPGVSDYCFFMKVRPLCGRLTEALRPFVV